MTLKPKEIIKHVYETRPIKYKSCQCT